VSEIELGTQSPSPELGFASDVPRLAGREAIHAAAIVARALTVAAKTVSMLTAYKRSTAMVRLQARLLPGRS
jgi:hypothetical protein